MATPTLRTEERIGLAVALAAHVVLFAWLAWVKPSPPPPPPERMTVTLSDTVGLTATSPHPAPEAAPDKAPEQGETAPQPTPVAKPLPIAKPDPVKLSQPTAKPPTQPVKAPAKPAGASSFDRLFAKGVPGAQGTSKATANAPAALGAQQQGALRAAIMRQIKPRWVAPQGIDAEKLVSVVRFRLNQSGRVIGEPEIVSQSGQTPANATQVRRHGEQAIRAIKLAQPFILPPDLYPYWQTVTSTFDKRLSQ